MDSDITYCKESIRVWPFSLFLQSGLNFLHMHKSWLISLFWGPNRTQREVQTARQWEASPWSLLNTVCSSLISSQLWHCRRPSFMRGGYFSPSVSLASTLLPKQPVFFPKSPNQPLFVFGNFGVKDFKHNLLDLLPLVCECGTGLYDKCREEKLSPSHLRESAPIHFHFCSCYSVWCHLWIIFS